MQVRYFARYSEEPLPIENIKVKLTIKSSLEIVWPGKGMTVHAAGVSTASPPFGNANVSGWDFRFYGYPNFFF